MKRLIGRLALAGLVALVALVVSLWIGHRVSVTLPAPTGPFAVGRVMEVWRDAGRSDALMPGKPTELVVWTWYPAAQSATQRPQTTSPPTGGGREMAV